MKEIQIIVVTMLLLLLTSCSQSPDKFIPSGSASIENENRTSTPSLKSDSPEVLSFNLSFTDMELARPLPIALSTENQVRLASKKLKNGEVYIYRNSNNKESVYAAIQSGSSRYEIGQIEMEAS